MQEIKPLVVGNWKMNLMPQQVNEFLKQLNQMNQNKELNQGLKIAIATSPIYLSMMVSYIKEHHIPVDIGAENCFYKDKGAYTGEVSPKALAKMGIKFVIVGHSERRKYFHENHFLINKKIKAVLRNHMVPILCCDEQMSLASLEGNSDWIVMPVVEGLKGISAEDVKHVIIAYEPVWAIGASHSASPHDAEEGCYLIRQTLANLYSDKIAEQIPILYGGSINHNNVYMITKQNNINGVLAGRSSLSVKSFLAVIKNSCKDTQKLADDIISHKFYEN